MSYSDAEVQAAVESLIRGGIRRPVDTLGVRRTDVTFTDYQEAAAGVFLLTPNAPFYLVALGAKRLLDVVRTLLVSVETTRVLLKATGRNVLGVKDVSPLFNARVALQALAHAAVSRTTGFNDVTKVPAHVQFENEANAFLQTNGAAVRQDGGIVPTPNEARVRLPLLLRDVQAAHEELVASALLLSNALTDFNGLNLPAVVSAGVMTRAATVVGEDAEALNALSPEARLEKVRGVVLNLLAAKAVVRTYGSFAGPSDFRALDGSGTPYSDATHLASPATITSDLAGAVGILFGSNDALQVTLDGGAAQAITLAPSPLALLVGQTTESLGTPNGFLIGDGINPTAPPGGVVPKNNEVHVRMRDNTGFDTTYVAPLTVSPSFSTLRTAEDVAADIQAALPSNVIAEVVFVPLEYSGLVNVTPSGGDTLITVPGGLVDFVALGVQPGDLVFFASGPNLGVHTVDVVAPLTLTLTGEVLSAQVNQQATVGPQLRRIELRCASVGIHLALETSLAVVGDGDLFSAAAGGLQTLGFSDGATSTSRRTQMRDVATDINNKVNGQVSDAVFHPFLSPLDQMPCRTDLADSQRVVFSHTEALGDASFVGAVLTLTNPVYFRTGVSIVGDVIVLRSGPNAGSEWTVSVVHDDGGLEATGTPGGTNTLGVSFEVGTPILPLPYDVLRILSGTNSGDYVVEGAGPTSIEVQVRGVFHLTRRGTQPLVMTAAYGDKRLRMLSANTTVASRIVLDGNAVPFFFLNLPPLTQNGTTPWFLLSSMPRGLEPGDLLEFYPTQYNVPSESHLVTNLFSFPGGATGLELATEVDNRAGWSFGIHPVPFARLRTGRLFDFQTFKSRLDGWLQDTVNTDLFFTNLNRQVNPLLVNKNPTAEDVGTAVNTFNEFYVLLSETEALAQSADPALALDRILKSYVVPSVEQVDTLLRTYKEKGASRAVDLLVSGQFAHFFQLDAEEVTYAGSLQKAVRDVARNDLPVRKGNRFDASMPRILSTAASPDYEYSRDDIESLGKPESL